MTDRDKDRDEKSATPDYLPGDEEFEEEPEEAAEAEGEVPEGEFESEGPAESAPGSAQRRFGFGRGSRDDRSGEEAERRQMGSVRGTHERVHIDDRPSAVYALLCAAALLGVLAFSWVGGVLPQSAGPTLTPLVVPTGQVTASPSAGASVTAAPSMTAAPTASPSASPSK
jgi:hypothetical protein